ncbi:MAG: cytochrome c biogenesis protein CcsA [Nitrospirales bacterium]|nr:cytochrome c biogenesis protein CcsA [Nitrospirales bacterium]
MMPLVIGAIALYLLSLWKRPFLYGGLILQAVYLFQRGIELGRLPLVGPHDTLTLMALSIALFSIPFSQQVKGISFQRLVGAVAAIFTAATLFFDPHNRPLPPILKTLWFEIHVSLSFLSYGLFGIGAILGGLYLWKKEQPLESLQYKAIFIGYSLFSLAMIAGGIWAYYAWGTYWLWTPKELWTTLLWVFYSLYLHARLRQQWMGKPAAIIGIAGFFVVLFTYLGVSLLMKSSHSFG